MKVVYFIAGGSKNGSNIAMLNFLLPLIEKGILEPTVIMNKRGDLCEILDENNIKYHIVKYLYAVYPKINSEKDFLQFGLKIIYIISINLWASFLLKKIIKRIKPDIIHTNVSLLQIGYQVANALSIPHVWHIREYMDLYFNYTPMLSWNSFRNKLNSKNNYSVYITEALQKHYRQKSNSFVINDGVKSESFKSQKFEKQNTFIFAGRLEEGKGIINVISTFSKFAKNNNDYKLIVVGAGERNFVESLIKIVDSNNLSNRVEFKGFQNDIDKFVSQSKALIMSSKNEGLGFTTIEAMFNNTLVIGKNSGGTKTILQNNQYGLLYNTNEELLEIMDRVSRNDINIDLCKSNLYVREKYSIERNSEKIKNLYYGICKKNTD